MAKQNGVRNQIFAAGIHLEDDKFQGNEVKFIKYIVYKIQNFQGIITGWLVRRPNLRRRSRRRYSI